MGQQSMSILTFGSTKRLDQSCKVVQIWMKLKDGSDHYLELFTEPTICKHLTSQPIAFCIERYGHLSRLNLTDYSDGDSEMGVDILIGTDHYWNIMTGRTVQEREVLSPSTPNWGGFCLDQHHLLEQALNLPALSLLMLYMLMFQHLMWRH